MIETITIVTVTLLLLAYFRPGKTEPLENPLTINKVGKFSALLAPKINLAQPLLDNMSGKLDAQQRNAGNSRTHYLTVQDKDVRAHGSDHYLLAMTLLDSMLYFQATAPVSGQEDIKTITTFSQPELNRHQASNAYNPVVDGTLMEALQLAAAERGAVVSQIS